MHRKKLSHILSLIENTYAVGVVFSFFDGQVDSLRGDESVGEDFLDGGKSDSLAVITVNDGHGEGVSEETLVYDISCLGCELDEVLEVGGSFKQKKKMCN